MRTEAGVRSRWGGGMSRPALQPSPEENRMPNVKLEALQVGMIVTTDVRNMDNMLLIPSGCALTERQINVLNAWGIAEIQVETCDGAEEPLDILQQLPPEALAKMSEELRASFWEPIRDQPRATRSLRFGPAPEGQAKAWEIAIANHETDYPKPGHRHPKPWYPMRA